MDNLFTTINKNISNYIEERLGQYINYSANTDFNLEKIFNYNNNYIYISDKLSIFGQNRHLDSYPLILAIEQLFIESNLNIQIYKSYVNSLYLLNIDYIKKPINIEFYTNTNLIIFIENFLPLDINYKNDNLRSVIHFYTKDLSIDYEIYAQLINNKIKFYQKDSFSNKFLIYLFNNFLQSSDDLINKKQLYDTLKNTINYINPNIYIDYLLFTDENIINNIIIKSINYDKLLKENEELKIKLYQKINNDLYTELDELKKTNIYFT